MHKGIGVWCNGNTADSGPAFPGSSPGTPTKRKIPPIGGISLFLILSIDCLDLLSDEVHVILQLLNLTVHLVDEAVTLL